MEYAMVRKGQALKTAEPLWRRFDNGTGGLVTWAARLGGLMLLAVGFFVFYEVICRYVFQSPTLWVMDYSIYFVMWGVFLGSGYTMRTRGHVLVDIVIKKIPSPNRRAIRIGTHLIILAFTLIIAAAGFYSCIRAYQMKELTLSALFIPLYYPMSSIPVGFSLMALEELALIGSLVFAEQVDGNHYEESSS
jgi:TRAP-type C4-dicarboxylate transport system permease small subunit